MDHNPEAVSKVTVPWILERKLRGERISCLTAYDYPTARLVDEAGIDMILVGDSLGQVVLGYDSTLPVTVEEVLHHLRAVRRGTRRALLVADMPYGAYHVSDEKALEAAIRYVKEGGAEAVKLEGGKKARSTGAPPGRRGNARDGAHRVNAPVGPCHGWLSSARQDVGVRHRTRCRMPMHCKMPELSPSS